ncbi:hypothetical protein [Microvirga makkahensis]|uniref:Rap1a immunity protein domain-containing protein n=1 Tax=Microvirga makkahensis TaxID=1128670 RepID=A0A7X3MS66_9HYPH|nr:hypothetical protein [Microvirga makkahensis]MXQ12073.1 hypothetical protein [Microvirga makkahensis]
MIRTAVETSARAGLFLILLTTAGQAVEGSPPNDYPTAARADYVFGCMAANGQSREMLERCSCSIDILASIMPYDRYVQAETILSMRQGVGEQLSLFRNAKMFDDIVAELRRAQAEAEIRCFR